MKKILAAALAMFMSVSLFGCSSGGTASIDPASDTESNDGVNVQEQEDNILEISLPLSLMEEGTTSELTQEEKNNGFLTKTVTGDEIKYTIKKSRYNAFMEDYKQTVEDSLNELVTSGDYPSVREIQNADDFGEITILVDKAAYESSFTDRFIILGAGLSGCLYKAFAVNSYKTCTVIVKDKTTGEELSRTTYPDALNTAE